VCRHRPIGREAALGVTRGFTPLQAPLPLAGRWRRMSGAVVASARPPMYHMGQERMHDCKEDIP
jgi:hypothetical protein